MGPCSTNARTMCWFGGSRDVRSMRCATANSSVLGRSSAILARWPVLHAFVPARQALTSIPLTAMSFHSGYVSDASMPMRSRLATG